MKSRNLVGSSFVVFEYLFYQDRSIIDVANFVFQV